MLFALALLASVSVPVGTPAAVGQVIPPVPDHELASMRGGMLLPNGLNVAVGIDIQTRIDGVLALHTIYSSEGPNSGIRVYTDGTTSPSTAPTTTVVSTQGAPVVVSWSPTQTTVIPSGGGPAMTINVVAGPMSNWLDAAGQTLIPVSTNGPAIDAAPGRFSLTNDTQGARVTLMAPSIEVQHLVGQATGAVILNTANNRVVDTVSSINVDLIGLPSGLLSGVLMVNRIAADAASGR